MGYNVAVLKIGPICHALDLWKLALSCKQFCLLGSPDLRNLPGAALLSEFRSSWGAVHGKYSWISNIEPVRVWNHFEARNEPVGPVNVLSNFYPRPVLAFGYCHHLCVCVCVYEYVCMSVSVCVSITCFPRDNLIGTRSS